MARPKFPSVTPSIIPLESALSSKLIDWGFLYPEFFSVKELQSCEDNVERLCVYLREHSELMIAQGSHQIFADIVSLREQDKSNKKVAATSIRVHISLAVITYILNLKFLSCNTVVLLDDSMTV